MFTEIVPQVATFIEFLGLTVVIIAVIRSFIDLVVVEKFNFILAEKDLLLNSGLSTALEIFLAAEILRTLVANSLDKLIQVGALVLIRIFIALVIHWESTQKEKHIAKQEIAEAKKSEGKQLSPSAATGD